MTIHKSSWIFKQGLWAREQEHERKRERERGGEGGSSCSSTWSIVWDLPLHLENYKLESGNQWQFIIAGTGLECLLSPRWGESARQTMGGIRKSCKVKVMYDHSQRNKIHTEDSNRKFSNHCSWRSLHIDILIKIVIVCLAHSCIFSFSLL